MKRYNFLFAISVILTVILIFCSVHVYSLSSEMPVFDGNDIDKDTLIGGADNLTLTVHKILYPLCAVACAALSVFSFRKARHSAGLSMTVCDKLKKSAPLHLFLLVSAFVTVASLIYASNFRSDVWDHQFFLFGNDRFMDFFNHITYVAEEPEKVYEQSIHACFPPLAYLFYYRLSTILPLGATVKFDADATSPYATIMYIVYMIVCCVILYHIVRKLLKNYSDGASLTLTLLLLVSSAFLAVTERGNSALIVLLLLLNAMYLRDSDKPLLRELALLCIAVAAGFKVYPALFGLLYVFEKRIWESVRLLAYGILFFFLPFQYFGGVEGFKLFIENQLAVQNDFYVSLTSISAAVRYVANELTNDPFALTEMADALPIIFAAICLLAFCNKRLKIWERTMLIVSVIAFVPSWSGSYTSIFFAIPMLLFFRDTRDGFGTGLSRAYRLICSVMFALAFSLMVFVSAEGKPAYELRYVALHVINLAVIYKSLILFIDSLLTKREKNLCPDKEETCQE